MNVIEVKNLGIKYNLNKIQSRSLRNKILKPFTSSKRFEYWALKNVSFEVKEGDIVAIIGRNGTGKSTLIKALAKIFIPDTGRVNINGKVSPLLTIGAGFRPELTGRDNIYLNGILLGLKKYEIENKLETIVKFSELESFIDQPVRTYSSGMRAKLGFSIAMNVNPDILLIDEVLGVGDKDFREKSTNKMMQFMQKAKAIVIVTHSISFIQKFCNKVIWLENGEVYEMGKTAEVIEKYINNS